MLEERKERGVLYSVVRYFLKLYTLLRHLVQLPNMLLNPSRLLTSGGQVERI